MNANSPSVRARFSNKTNAVRKIILCLIFVVGAGTSTYGQGDIPSGTVSGSGSGPYSYSLTFADAAGVVTDRRAFDPSLAERFDQRNRAQRGSAAGAVEHVEDLAWRERGHLGYSRSNRAISCGVPSTQTSSTRFPRTSSPAAINRL